MQRAKPLPVPLLHESLQEAEFSNVTDSELISGLPLVLEVFVELHEEWKVIHDKLVHDYFWESREPQEFCSIWDPSEMVVVVKFKHHH